KPRRGISAITDRGRAVLREYPERVDMSVLEQFSEYVEFRTRSSGRRRVTQPVTPEQLPISTSTPEETIDTAYGQVRTALAEELLTGCPRACSPATDRSDRRTRARNAHGRRGRRCGDPSGVRAQADRRGLLRRGRVAPRFSRVLPSWLSRSRSALLETHAERG